MSVTLSEQSRESIDRILNNNSDVDAFYKILGLCYMKLNVSTQKEICQYIPRPKKQQSNYCYSTGGWSALFNENPRRCCELMDRYILKLSHPEKLPPLPREMMGNRIIPNVSVKKESDKNEIKTYSREYLESLEKQDLIRLILYPNLEIIKEKMRMMTDSGTFDNELIQAYAFYTNQGNKK